MKGKRWPPEDDATLRKLVEEGHKWSSILPMLPGRKLADIQNRWRHLKEKEVKGEPSEWSSEEDLVLVYLAGDLKNKWKELAKIYPRTSKDLSNRWGHVLQRRVNKFKSAKEKPVEDSEQVSAQALLELTSQSAPADSQQEVAPFTWDEDLALCHLIGAHDHWSTISSFFPHRKEEALKDRWNNALKDKVFSKKAELKKKLEQLEKNKAENLKQLAKEGAATLPDAAKEQLEENTVKLKKAAKEGNVEDMSKAGAAILSDTAKEHAANVSNPAYVLIKDTLHHVARGATQSSLCLAKEGAATLPDAAKEQLEENTETEEGSQGGEC